MLCVYLILGILERLSLLVTLLERVGDDGPLLCVKVYQILDDLAEIVGFSADGIVFAMKTPSFLSRYYITLIFQNQVKNGNKTVTNVTERSRKSKRAHKSAPPCAKPTMLRSSLCSSYSAADSASCSAADSADSAGSAADSAADYSFPCFVSFLPPLGRNCFGLLPDDSMPRFARLTY